MGDLRWNRDFAFEQSGEDTELLEELLDLLVVSSISDLAKVEAGFASGDGDVIADAAHSIKGASASLGVEGLREVAYDFEKKGRAGDLEGLDVSVLEDLVSQLHNLKA